MESPTPAVPGPRTPGQNAATSPGGPAPVPYADYEAELQRAAVEWIRDNQVLAMAAGFALGVFVGVLMRD